MGKHQRSKRHRQKFYDDHCAIPIDNPRYINLSGGEKVVKQASPPTIESPCPFRKEQMERLVDQALSTYFRPITWQTQIIIFVTKVIPWLVATAATLTIIAFAMSLIHHIVRAMW